MGCYSWFARPITDEEFKLMHEYAEEHIKSYVNDVDELYFNRVLNSIKNNIPVYKENGKDIYWWMLGWGCANPKLPNNFSVVYEDKKLYVSLSHSDHNDVPSCDDLRVVFTYPHKVIHNKKELRRYLRKRYFDLTPVQHELLTAFWKHYPGGILYWG